MQSELPCVHYCPVDHNKTSLELAREYLATINATEATIGLSRHALDALKTAYFNRQYAVGEFRNNVKNCPGAHITLFDSSRTNPAEGEPIVCQNPAYQKLREAGVSIIKRSITNN